MWIESDVSGLPIGPIFKGQTKKKAGDLKLSSWRTCPEMSVSNHPTPRNNPEDGRIQFNRGGSQSSQTVQVAERSV